MIEITKYLQTVYEDLQRYVDNDVCLCKGWIDVLEKRRVVLTILPSFVEK